MVDDLGSTFPMSQQSILARREYHNNKIVGITHHLNLARLPLRGRYQNFSLVAELAYRYHSHRMLQIRSPILLDLSI
jgi:hypothetical protein